MGLYLFLSMFIFLSSWVFVGFSNDSLLEGVVLVHDSNDVGTCVQKLLPCQPYLQSSSAPPPSCCVPLKQMITDDTQCLCNIFNNAQLLKNFNVTQEQALKLPKECGANADISICNKAAAPPGSPATPSTPSNSSSSTNSPPKSDAVQGVSQIGGSFSYIALLGTFIVISLF